MRRGTGYAYGDGYSDGEDCISYKCEGCGRRVRVTPTQARQFRGAFTACSKICVLKARDLRAQQAHPGVGGPGPSEGTDRTQTLRPADGATGV